MRITDIEALHLRIADVGEICNGTQDALLARVHADVGLVGLGQGDDAPQIMAAIDAPISNSFGCALREAAVGEDPREVERVTREAPGLGIELNEDVVERYLVQRSAPDSAAVA